MTAAALTPSIEYLENGVTTVFAVPFRFRSPQHISASRVSAAGVVTALLYGTDYSVTGGSTDAGGSLTVSAAAIAGTRLRIKRVTPRAQTMDYTSGDTFPAESHEAALDTAMLIDQEQDQKIDDTAKRSYLVPDGETAGIVPKSGDRGGKFFGWGPTGDPIALSGTGNDAALRTDLASSLLGTLLIAWKAGGIGTVLRTLWSRLTDLPLTPEDYGALADGSNDTAAFAALANAINLAGGGTITLGRNKTYRVGGQQFAGAGGLGYSYRALDILSFKDCTKPIIIDLNGSTIQMVNGQKMGSFNPTTGLAHVPALPFTDANYRADPGIIIKAKNCAEIMIRNGELDGSSATIVLGGQYGDTGYQCEADGIMTQGCKKVMVDSVYSHHHGRDCALLGQYGYGLTANSPSTPIYLNNCVFDYGSRQALSWTGGIGLRATNCKFLRTGRGAFQSAPAACLDIEAELSICRDGIFENCEFADSYGVAMLADAGDNADVTFRRCRFFGTTANSIWVNKPGFVFEECLISGLALPQKNAWATPEQRTKLIRCTFANVPWNGRPIFGTLLFDDNFGAHYSECSFKAGAGVEAGFSVAAARFSDCIFVQNGSANTAFLRGTYDGECKITMTTGAADLFGSKNNGYLTVSGSILGIPSYGGRVIGATSPPWTRTEMFADDGVGGRINKVEMNTAAPVAGTHSRADRVINANPIVGGPVGFVSTASGTPGTWHPYGIVGAVQAASVSFAAGANPTKVEFDALITSLKNAKLMA